MGLQCRMYVSVEISNFIESGFALKLNLGHLHTLNCSNFPANMTKQLFSLLCDADKWREI